MLGKILLQQNNVTAAIEVFRHGVATFPEHPELCTTLGLLYMQVMVIHTLIVRLKFPDITFPTIKITYYSLYCFMCTGRGASAGI